MDGQSPELAATLSRIADVMANHACKTLGSQDNITVQILYLKHDSAKGRRSATGPVASEIFASSRPGPLPKSAYGRPSRGASKRGAVALAADPAPVSSTVSETPEPVQKQIHTDDDLMDFLLDDKNF